MSSSTTPAAVGFAMPAEWKRHEATWIGWPHNKHDWPGKFAPIPWVFGEMAKALSRGEKVRVLVNDTVHETFARRVLNKCGADMGNIEFFRFATNRGWTRDLGPVFVKKGAENAIVNFKFNAWAKYPDWKKDNGIAPKVAKKLNKRLFDAQHFVLEGGAIDVNGCGTLLTTEECLLDTATQVRNPGMGRAETEDQLRALLGVTNILWLGKGIAGDDTHGHVDDLCRFVNSSTVALCRENNSHDPNYVLLEENRERLQAMRLENGGKVQVVELPMPAPVIFNGQRLPASYANFYIGNAAVIVPTFNDPKDRIALGILSELFADRPVVGIHAVDLVWGLGTLHCLTQQQPA